VTVDTLAFADADALAEGACAFAMEKIEEALQARGRALVVLAGGTTPRNTYHLLADALTAKRVPSKRLLWLFGDERWVPVDDPQSNEGMARESLLRPIKAPVSTVISWAAGSGEPVDCAMRYAEKARAAMKDGEFDLVFLGVGADGHTASLFPDGDVHLSAGSSRPVGPDVPGLAAAVSSQSARGWRLTLCPGALNRSRAVVFLVAGEEKAPALRRARAGDPATPAAWIRGRTTVYMATRSALGPEAPDYGREVRHA